MPATVKENTGRQLERQYELFNLVPDPALRLSSLQGLRARVVETYNGCDPAVEIKAHSEEFLRSRGAAWLRRSILGEAVMRISAFGVGRRMFRQEFNSVRNARRLYKLRGNLGRDIERLTLEIKRERETRSWQKNSGSSSDGTCATRTWSLSS